MLKTKGWSKILIALMLGIMLLGFSGCGNNTPNNDEEQYEKCPIEFTDAKFCGEIDGDIDGDCSCLSVSFLGQNVSGKPLEGYVIVYWNLIGKDGKVLQSGNSGYDRFRNASAHWTDQYSGDDLRYDFSEMKEFEVYEFDIETEGELICWELDEPYRFKTENMAKDEVIYE